MEQHDDAMRATCLTCGAAGPNWEEDVVHNPGNHYCARCWKRYWETVGATLSVPSTQQDGIVIVPCDDDDDGNRRRRRQKSLTGHLCKPPPPHNRPNHLQKIILFGNLCGESCRNPIREGPKKCNHDGCNAMVHFYCQFSWLGKAGCEVDVKALVISQGTAINTRNLL